MANAVIRNTSYIVFNKDKLINDLMKKHPDGYSNLIVELGFCKSTMTNSVKFYEDHVDEFVSFGYPKEFEHNTCAAMKENRWNVIARGLGIKAEKYVILPDVTEEDKDEVQMEPVNFGDTSVEDYLVLIASLLQENNKLLQKILDKKEGLTKRGEAIANKEDK